LCENVGISETVLHYKYFSILELTIGDSRLSPAYDLLNTRLHIPNDTRFALVDGLLPTTYARDNIKAQFKALAEQADLPMRQYDSIMSEMLSRQDDVEAMIYRSFLSDAAREKYYQHYKERVMLLGG
jgi:serine/threonine-protein kinase HipA